MSLRTIVLSAGLAIVAVLFSLFKDIRTIFLFPLNINKLLNTFHENSTILPSKDPFYTPPAGYETATPGRILRSRPAPQVVAAFGVLPINISHTYQLLYRSNDGRNKANAAVTTIIVPHNVESDKLLSYQTAYDSASIDCSPSYDLLKGARITAIDVQAEILLIASALNQGWIVSVPDYEGPKAAFTAGIQAGHATLDGIRAAVNSGNITGIDRSAHFAMWGYSGGGLATEWAAELAPSYAPDLKANFLGAAMGGLTPNLTSVVQSVNKKQFAGLVPAGYLGLATQYSNLTSFMDRHLKRDKVKSFRKVTKQCLPYDETEFKDEDVFTYFDNGEKALTDPIPQSVINAGAVMGLTNTPDSPLFVYEAVGDEVSPIQETDNLLKKYCASGAQIHYKRDHVGGHATEAITGSSDAFAWLIDRFNGVQAPEGCRTENVELNELNKKVEDAAGMEIANALGALLGKSL